jgi:ankyrin repeat protein
MIVNLLFKKDQNFNFVFMISLRDYIFHILMLFILLSVPVNLLSQEETEIDTSEYMTFSMGFNMASDKQEILNYNLKVAASKGYVSEIHRLIKNGALPDASLYDRVTPLMFAVVNNQLDAVNALLSYKVDVNVMTAYLETPLLAAVKNGNLEIAEALIRDSADVNISDTHGATPLHYASIYGYFYLTDLLLYYNAETYRKTTDGTTPLMAAVWAGHFEITDLLIQNGANPEETDNLDFTPFLIAAQNGDTLIMELLIKRNIDLYEVNRFNYNALDLAIKSNQMEAVGYLLRKSDKWISNSKKSISPYLVAAKYSRKEIEQILEKNNLPKSYKFGFDQVSISASFKGCLHDYFAGLAISFKEPFINAGIFAGFDFKPGYTRVLIKTSESQFYQYMDKSSMIYAGLFKDFKLTDNPLKGNWFVSGSVAAGYTFGNKLKGTAIVPPNKFKIIPEIAFKWTKNHFNLFGGLDFLKTDFYKVGPVWLRVGASYNIFFDNVRAPGKEIKWY